VCRDSGWGQTIYIHGEAGIGKTRLLEEFRNAARGAGFACHTSLMLDFGSRIGRDAIETLARSVVLPADDDGSVSANWLDQGR
jgi:predicted ATPase